MPPVSASRTAAPRPPRKPLNLRALLIPAGVLAGLLIVGLVGFFVIRTLSNNGCESFSTARSTVTLDGLTIGVRPDALNGNFGVKLNKIPLNEFSAGSSNADAKAAAAALPAALKPVSAFYNISTCNTAPKAATLRLNLPADVTPSDTLDLYAWDPTARAWRWVGGGVEDLTKSVVAQVSSVPPSLVLVQTTGSGPALGVEVPAGPAPAVPAFATEAYPYGLMLGEQGTLNGDRSLVAAAVAGAKAFPVVRNYNDKGEISAGALKDLLGSDAVRDANVRNIVSLVETGGYVGAEVDFRGIDVANRDKFSAYVNALATALHGKNKQLAVVIPAPERTASVDPATMWNAGGYDASALSQNADIVSVDLSLSPGALSREALAPFMDWAIGRINRAKLQIIMPLGSMRIAANGSVTPISQEEALAPLGTFAPDQAINGPVKAGTKVVFRLSGGIDPATVLFDAASQTYRYAMTDAAGKTQVVYVATPSTLAQRLNALSGYNLRGVTLRGGVQYADAAIVSALNAYQKQAQSPAATGDLVVAFSVKAPDGSVIPARADLSNPVFEWTAPEKAGAYAIGSAIETGGSAIGRGGVTVEVAAAPTPTPGPTATVYVTPRPIPTRDPNAPTDVPRPTATPKPTAVPAAPTGGGMTGFGIGAHVKTDNNLGGYLPQMASIGMTWAKVQIVMPGGAPDIGGLKAQLNASGVKMLVGAIGNRARASDTNYHKEFAAALASLARQGVEAIEVWNEPNLDREYGGSYVNPENYANMLREAYIAIKAANPNTIVIGGAAAPTGYFGGNCTNIGCDDLPFLQRVAAAGGTSYMDCQGAHFNGSPHPPSMTTGGNPGGHYSWYFYGTLDTTFAAIGGKKPVCFTELGYVTLQDIGRPMPPGFEWGASITLQNQADWIADAINRARASGKVRLVIVWNANFHNFDGNDPQVGFSIFRPSGQCPACATIRAVMGR